MELFDVVPNNMFSVFTSKNKELYASSLLILRQLFKQEIMIEKEKLATSLVNALEQELYNIDMSEENEIDIQRIGKDALSLARFIIRKFKDTGWIEVEYENKTSFIEYITLPPYSVKLINTLHDIVEEETREYSTYMFAIYSSLKQADMDKDEYRYASLVNSYDKTLELENELKVLYHNLRRKYNRLSSLNTVNDMLHDHFDEYQQRIINQVFLPLKTKDSITRFKGNVFSILNKWIKDKSIIDEIALQAKGYLHTDDIDKCKSDVLTKVYFIIDKINDLEELLNKIDIKNNDYVTSTADKLRYLLNSDKSIKGKLTKIFDKLAVETEYGGSSTIEMCADKIGFIYNGYVAEESCFTRANPSRLDYVEPVTIDTFDDATTSELSTRFYEDTLNPFSTEKIYEFMEEQLKDKNEVDSKELDINNMQDLVMTIFAMLKGDSLRSFYRVKLFDDYVTNWEYSIPNMKFVRRKS